MRALVWWLWAHHTEGEAEGEAATDATRAATGAPPPAAKPQERAKRINGSTHAR